jgi:hypothetical protein
LKASIDSARVCHSISQGRLATIHVFET